MVTQKGNIMKRKSASICPVLLMVVAMLLVVIAGGPCSAAAEASIIQVGSELDFAPYALVDENGQPAGFSVDLIRAVAEAMDLSLNISADTWNTVWNDLAEGRIDALPLVAKMPSRTKLVDFSLPHTETYDSFFVRKGDPFIKNIEDASGKEIVVMRSDAAHHALLDQNFEGNLILVDTIPAGLSLISSGKHDAFLCSKLIGVFEIKQHSIKGLAAGPTIPDYKRVFSFAVKKGDAELLEKLNQGLLIVKASGEYQQIYNKWLRFDDPWLKFEKYLMPIILVVTAVFLLGGFWLYMLRRQVSKRTRELAEKNELLRRATEGLETKVMERTDELVNTNAMLQAEITDRTKAEKDIEKIFNMTNYMICTGDLQGNFTRVNKSFEQILGYSSEELLGQPYINLIHPEDKEKTLNVINNEMSRGTKIIDFENRYRCKDGTYKWLSWTSQPDPETGVAYAIAYDITESKHLEEELRKMQKLESVGILAGGIAHDFNNLLAAIRNNVYLSKMLADHESKIYKSMESAENIIDRATSLTQQLLTFSKGGAPVKKTAFIVELINESAEFVLRGTSIKCECNMSDNIWTVDVDEGQMNQVIHNLVLNAVQSMPKGGDIRISTENSELVSDSGLPLQEGRHVKIIIKDQGIGITEEHLKNVFDPYFTTKEMGRGLGLSVVYSIIKNHDGHISVESKLGAGATFTIYLPASEKQIEAEETLEDTFIAGEGKILLMDDEEIIRETAEQLLTHKGYTVECAKDGEEAIDLYKKAMEASKPFNAVILDLTIRGGMGGKDAVKKLREIDPNVKAIVASGYSNDPVLANFKEYGFVGVFAKHDKTTELGKTLHKVINGYH